MSLSRGQWHLQVPKEYRANLRFRRKLLDITCRSEANREAIWQACKEDLLFFVDAFVFTYNPKKKQKLIPFIAYPYQADAFRVILKCIDEGRDLVIEKSRDMGASWIALIVFTWLWLFHPGFTFLLLSRQADLVDKPGDPDSLFWKIDKLLELLPSWMTHDVVSDENGKSVIGKRKYVRRKMGFEFPGNSSTMDGAASTAAASVGGRRSAILLDEFSRMDNADEILGGTSDVADCRIFNFTPWGTNNTAYELAKRPDIKKLRFHWSVHPVKGAGLYQYRKLDDQGQTYNRVFSFDDSYAFPDDYHYIMDGKLRSPWYDKECVRRKDKRDIAMNLDIDYQGSAYQPFDKEEILRLVHNNSYPARWVGDLQSNDAGKCEGIAKADRGPLRLWVALDIKNRPPPGSYGIGIDISTGDGATNSVASVGNLRTGEKVAELCTNVIGAIGFAWKCTALADLFKDENGIPAKICWESQGPGTTFGKEIIRIGFFNIYYKTNDLTGKSYEDPGWYPSVSNKRDLLTNYRTAIYDGRFCNRSEEALKETLDFIVVNSGAWEHSGVKSRKNSDPNDTGDNHGDRVIADALCWKMVDEANMLEGKRDLPYEEEVLYAISCLAGRRQRREREKVEELDIGGNW